LFRNLILISQLTLLSAGLLFPWSLALAYDNPEASILDDVYADKIFAQFPSLLGRRKRNVVAISLWKTEGRLWDWECVDKILLNNTA
jgi:hypothetical protein